MPVLDPHALIRDRIDAIREMHRSSGISRAAIDVSGGIDSAVILMLAARALGPDEVMAVHSRIHSNPDALARAQAVCDAAGVRLCVIDLTATYENLLDLMLASMSDAGHDGDAAKARLADDPTVAGSIRSTLRAPIGRGFNRLFGGGIRHGTGNECEDRFLRFYQKGGDGEVDSNPIAMLSKGEVFQLARALGVPRSILTARPSPDLWGEGDGHNDEDELANYLGHAPAGATFYSYIDPATGAYTHVGIIERISRFLDGALSDARRVGDVLFDDDTVMDAPRVASLLAAVPEPFAGIARDDAVRLSLAACRIERVTRHKLNPNCPTSDTATISSPPGSSPTNSLLESRHEHPPADHRPAERLRAPRGRPVRARRPRHMDRLAAFIDRASDQITSIDVTLDSHRLDISHPLWWRHGETGEMPAPFTQITAADVEAGTWKAYDPGHQARSLAYLHALAAEGGYPHTIWPEHCLIGHAGHNVWPTLAAAIHRWEDAGRHTTFVHKGDNPWTEHFSAVRAEVPYADDPSTDVDHDLLARIRASDITLVAGEARSHCVANTVRDILRHADDADTRAQAAPADRRHDRRARPSRHHAVLGPGQRLLRRHARRGPRLPHDRDRAACRPDPSARRASVPRRLRAKASRYPRPGVTVDVLAFTIVDEQLRLLLIRRNAPFRDHWCCRAASSMWATASTTRASPSTTPPAASWEKRPSPDATSMPCWRPTTSTSSSSTPSVAPAATRACAS